MARTNYPSDKQDQFMLRLPDGMRDRIKAAAERNNRSMNAEIVATLEEAYPENSRWEMFINMFSEISADDQNAVLKMMKALTEKSEND